MRKILIPIALLTAGISTTTIFAHNSTTPFYGHRIIVRDTVPAAKEAVELIIDKKNAPFGKVEIEAGFPGGEPAWKSFLMANLNPDVPVKNNAPEDQYMVVVQFIVDTTGSISDIKALTHYGYGMEQEVICILQQSPKWQPAQQDGRLVKAYRKQPITFAVEKEKKKRRLL